MSDDGALRVALIATHTAPARGHGGIAEAVARTARAWAERGRLVVLCASDAGEVPIMAEDVGLPLPATTRLYHAWGWRRWGFGFGAIPAILRVCREADVVYVAGVGTWPTTIAGLVCRVIGRPFVIGLHAGLMPGHVAHIKKRKPLKRLFYQTLTLPTAAAARTLHATSLQEAEGARALIPRVPVVVVPNAVDPAEWSFRPQRPSDGGLTIAYVGRLSPEKGILPFIKAWAAARGPRDRLLISGDGRGAYAAKTRARVARSAGQDSRALAAGRSGTSVRSYRAAT